MQMNAKYGPRKLIKGGITMHIYSYEKATVKVFQHKLCCGQPAGLTQPWRMLKDLDLGVVYPQS